MSSYFTEFYHDGRTFRLHVPLRLYPRRCAGLWSVEHYDLGIDVYGDSLEHLLEELNQQVAMLWDNYAIAEDETLAPSALKLKAQLLAAFVAPTAKE